MKPREFSIRPDQEPGAQLRRLHAFIRSISPRYKIMGRMERKIVSRRTARLLRVK